MHNVGVSQGVAARVSQSCLLSQAENRMSNPGAETLRLVTLCMARPEAAHGSITASRNPQTSSRATCSQAWLQYLPASAGSASGWGLRWSTVMCLQAPCRYMTLDSRRPQQLQYQVCLRASTAAAVSAQQRNLGRCCSSPPLRRLSLPSIRFNEKPALDSCRSWLQGAL